MSEFLPESIVDSQAQAEVENSQSSANLLPSIPEADQTGNPLATVLQCMNQLELHLQQEKAIQNSLLAKIDFLEEQLNNITRPLADTAFKLANPRSSLENSQMANSKGVQQPPSHHAEEMNTKEPVSFLQTASSRRKLLQRLSYGAAGLTIAGLAATLNAESVQAASGDNLLLGNSNLASDTTYLSQTSGATTLDKRAILWADYNATGQSTNPGSLTAEYKIGLAGSSTSSISTDVAIGGYFTGSTAPLLLQASATAGFPTTGTHKQGELYVDSAGDLCYLASTAGGNKWRKLAGTATVGTLHIVTPFRLFDTGDAGNGIPLVEVATVKSSSLGGTPNGKFAAGESRVYKLNVGTSPIPVTAKGIVGNFGVSYGVFPGLPGQTGSAGFGTIFPSGLTAPSASSLSFHNTGYSPTGFSNNYTVGLDTATTGEVLVSLYTLRAARITLDVTGFYL